MKKLIVLSKYVLAFLIAIIADHFFLSIINIDDGVNIAIAPMLIAGLAQAGIGAYQYFNEQGKQNSLNKQMTGFVSQMRSQLAALSNPYANLQTSDRGEKLALDQSSQMVAGLTGNLYSAEQTAQATNLVRGQQQQALEAGANLSRREEQTDKIRAEGEEKLQQTKLDGEQNILDKQMKGAQGFMTVSQENQNTALAGITTGITNTIAGGIESSKLYKDGKALEDATDIYKQLEVSKMPAGMTKEDAIDALKGMKKGDRKGWTGMTQNWDDFDYTIFDN